MGSTPLPTSWSQSTIENTHLETTWSTSSAESHLLPTGQVDESRPSIQGASPGPWMVLASTVTIRPKTLRFRLFIERILHVRPTRARRRIRHRRLSLPRLLQYIHCVPSTRTSNISSTNTGAGANPKLIRITACTDAFCGICDVD
jgi:hypothetical protein